MTSIDTDKFIITDFRSITFEQFDNFVKKEECGPTQHEFRGFTNKKAVIYLTEHKETLNDKD